MRVVDAGGARARGMRAGAGRGLVAAGLTTLAFVVAGCGGAKAPPVANLSTTSSVAAAAARRGSSGAGVAAPNRGGLAACLTAHGFTASVGSAATAPDGALSIEGVIVSGGADPSSPQFRAALAACHKYLPKGPPPLSGAQQVAAAKAMLAFASCMRGNGVPGFPDPTSQGVFPVAGIQGVDPSSPLVLTAFRACESLEPKVGPRIEFGAGGVAERR
jgi:hypothetical protein